MLSLTCLSETTRHEQKSSKKSPELIPYQGKPEVVSPKNRIQGRMHMEARNQGQVSSLTIHHLSF